MRKRTFHAGGVNVDRKGNSRIHLFHNGCLLRYSGYRCADTSGVRISAAAPGYMLATWASEAQTLCKLPGPSGELSFDLYLLLLCFGSCTCFIFVFLCCPYG